MEDDRKYTCCFSGHRSNKLPWKYQETGETFVNIKTQIKTKIEWAIQNNYKRFITGMALGIDMLCAELVLSLKNKYPNIQLECAIPCKNQTRNWQTKNIIGYNQIISKADLITFVSYKNYYKGCMQKGNKYMVDKSNLLIAIYNGCAGGTKQTIEYARQQNINIHIIQT